MSAKDKDQPSTYIQQRKENTRKELNLEEVSHLLEETSTETRIQTTQRIAEVFDRDFLNKKELRVAEDIFRMMAQDTEVSVRAALSEALKHSPILPKEVALSLAHDVETVSIPILQFSQVLTDSELIEIVKEQNPEKQKAIAAREKVSENLSEAIVEEAISPDVIATLVSNTGAKISENAMHLVIDKYGKLPKVHEPLIKREFLPLTVAERLVSYVSDSLQEYLASHHDLPPLVVSDIILNVRERATLQVAASRKRYGDLQILIDQLHNKGKLLPSLMLRSLCIGDIAFFEQGMAKLGGVPIENARILIHDKGVLGLKALYERIKFPPKLYPAFRVAIDVFDETHMDGQPKDQERYRKRLLERILTNLEDNAGVGTDNLDFLMTKLIHYANEASEAATTKAS